MTYVAYEVLHILHTEIWVTYDYIQITYRKHRVYIQNTYSYIQDKQRLDTEHIQITYS
jgi:hypothetical protein